MNPRIFGVACAVIATALGLMYMNAAGAPALYLAVNALSLAMGLALFALIPPDRVASTQSGGTIIALGGGQSRRNVPRLPPKRPLRS